MSRVVGIATSRLKNYLDFLRSPLDFYVQLMPQGDVVSLRTDLFQASYIVNSPDFIQEILVTKEKYFRKGRTSHVLRRTIGDGLLTAEQGEHERQKKYMQPLFYKERIANYAHIVVDETEKLVARLREQQQCSLHDEMMQLTLAIITRTMFATDVDERKQELAAAVTATIEQSAKTLFRPFTLPLTVPTPGHRIHRHAIRKLEAMVSDVLADARQHPERYHLSLVGMLLDTKYDDGQPISDREIRDQMITMLLAGHETSANLLTWIFYELSRHPEVTAKFQQEVDELAHSGVPLEASYRQLNYTQLIIQEGLRLYPPAWLLYREANEDVELLGERFRKNSTFVVCPYALHRNLQVFAQPEQFMPERFADGAASKLPKFTYFPFGGGSRSCIGSRFALMETALIMAVLGRELSFSMVEPRVVTPEPLVSLRIKDGLRMNISQRNG